MPTAAIYGRISLDTEASVSEARQTRECRDYAEKHGFTVVLEAFDPGVRATKIPPQQRPGWRQIMAAGDTLDAVIVWSLDRLVRSSRDWTRVQEWAENNQIRIATASSGELDLDDPTGEFTATLMAALGRLEARQIGARATSARKQLVHDGRRAGGRRCWPLQTAPNPDGAGLVLRPIPERAEAIRTIAARIIEDDATLAGSARWLDQQGLRPDPASNRQSDRWHISPLKRLLLNPSLMGAQTYHGQPVRDADGTIRIDQDQAILDPETFTALQTKLSSRRAGQRPPLDALLSGGLLRCGSCGHAMNPRQATASYVCSKTHCPKPAGVRIAAADRLYVDAWLNYFGNAATAAPADTSPDPAEIATLREALGAVRAELATFPDDTRTTELTAQGRALQDRLGGLTAPRAKQPRPFKTGPTWGALYRAASDKERRRILQAFNAPVTVVPGERGGRQDPAARFRFDEWDGQI